MTDDNQKAIILTAHKGSIAAREMIDELVSLGATPNEISDAIGLMNKTATDAAKVLLDRRDAGEIIKRNGQ